MGCGDFPCGVGPCGFDPVYVPAPLAPPFLPRAEYFDPFQKRFFSTQEALDGDYSAETTTYIDMHPITQIVVLRGTTKAGQSQSASDLGTRLAAICDRQPPARIPQLAYQEVSRVYQDLIENNDIILVSVVADTSVRGRNQFAIAFVNLRDPKTNAKFPLQNQQTVNALAPPTTTA